MSNAFTSYEPQLSWKGHDNGHKQSANGTKAAAMASAKITLPGSLSTGKPALMGIPSRDSINTLKTKQADKTDMIRRGWR